MLVRKQPDTGARTVVAFRQPEQRKEKDARACNAKSLQQNVMWIFSDRLHGQLLFTPSILKGQIVYMKSETCKNRNNESKPINM